MKLFALISFAVLASLSTAEHKESALLQEYIALTIKLQERVTQLETRLNQNDCPCDLSPLRKLTLEYILSCYKLFFLSLLEQDIKQNAEEITKNTIDVKSLKSDMDEVIGIANGVAKNLTDVSASVTGLLSFKDRCPKSAKFFSQC